MSDLLQPTWTAAMESLLTVAEGALVANPGSGDPVVPLSSLVKRTFLAPGPDFARDCSLLAVYFGGLSSLPLHPSDALGGICITVPSIRLVLVYAEDCVPAQTDKGAAPGASAIEEFTTMYVNRATALWQYVTDAALSGVLDVGGCGDATVEDAEPRGPLGGVAQTLIPVRLRLQA